MRFAEDLIGSEDVRVGPLGGARVFDEEEDGDNEVAVSSSPTAVESFFVNELIAQPAQVPSVCGVPTRGTPAPVVLRVGSDGVGGGRTVSGMFAVRVLTLWRNISRVLCACTRMTLTQNVSMALKLIFLKGGFYFSLSTNERHIAGRIL